LSFNLLDHIGSIVLAIFILAIIGLLLLFVGKIVTTILDGIEMVYALFTKRPVFIHFYLFKRRLNTSQTFILEQEFMFYKRLDDKRKTYFRHRVATFINHKVFEGKEDFVVTDEVKILVAATAVMLTFGFRNYLIKHIKRIVVYPSEYYSRFSKTNNKGEFNPRLKALVLSWDNFLEGHKIEDDKLNLGIHEFAHAIHYNAIKSEDINSVIFVDTFNDLRFMLSSNAALKAKVVNSQFIRSYAFTNDSELLAVVIETCIESPVAFKALFPDIYSKVKQMLNFNFARY